MVFSTVVSTPPDQQEISHHHKLMLLGSCFTENIGNKLTAAQFMTDVNPFGIAYNPLSIATILERLINGAPLTTEELQYINGQWFSFLHHGSFSAPDREQALQNINHRLIKAARFLPGTDLLIITWGTAWVYQWLQNNTIVNNCHKLPEREFQRFRLTVAEIVDTYTLLFNRLQEINPQLRIIFTVSPIRHWKDGAHGNQLSKATLLLAIDQLIASFPRVSYFPAYEIVMDELRDYRFYASDMLHLSEVAIDYIWERFSACYFSPDTITRLKHIDRINRGLAHRPFDKHSENYRLHLQKISAEIRSLQQQFPHFFSDFSLL